MNSQNTTDPASFVPDLDQNLNKGFIPVEQAKKLDELDGHHKTITQPTFYPQNQDQPTVYNQIENPVQTEEVIEYPYNESQTNEYISTENQQNTYNDQFTSNVDASSFDQNLSSIDTAYDSNQTSYSSEQAADTTYIEPTVYTASPSPFLALFPWLLSLVGVISIVAALVWGILYPASTQATQVSQNFCGSSTVIKYENNQILCENNGKLFIVSSTEDITGIEKTQAINGNLIFRPNSFEKLTKEVYSNQNTTQKSGGIVVYSNSLGNEQVQKMTVNNLFLFSGSDKQNEVNVIYVTNFLDKTGEFNGLEPLGNESVVLRAFQIEKTPQKSKTLGEITNLPKTNFSKVRAVYGVDGEGVNKKQLMVRVMVQTRGNVAMLSSQFSKETQLKVDTKLTKCSTTTKFGSDFDTCIQEALKDDGLTSEAEKITSGLLKTFDAQ
jgi:hypothetical protein